MTEPSNARSVEELLQSITESNRPKYVYFWGHTPKIEGAIDKSCFSQWFPSVFTFDGNTFATAEHFMMAQKAKLFSDDENFAKILEAKSPGAAKALGRTVLNFDQLLWEKHRFEIVVQASVLKFSSDTRLRDYLVGTGSRVLVEASPTDQIWGIGLDAESAENKDPSQWNGRNLLGFALMEARERIANDA